MEKQNKKPRRHDLTSIVDKYWLFEMHGTEFHKIKSYNDMLSVLKDCKEGITDPTKDYCIMTLLDYQAVLDRYGVTGK